MFLYSPRFHPPTSLLYRGKFSVNQGKKGAKVNKFLGAFGVLSGFSETKRVKSKDIFVKGLQEVGAGGRLLSALRCVHLCSCSALVASGPAGACPLLSVCVPSLFGGFLALPL